MADLDADNAGCIRAVLYIAKHVVMACLNVTQKFDTAHVMEEQSEKVKIVHFSN